MLLLAFFGSFLASKSHAAGNFSEEVASTTGADAVATSNFRSFLADEKNALLANFRTKLLALLE